MYKLLSAQFRQSNESSVGGTCNARQIISAIILVVIYFFNINFRSFS